MIRGSRPRRSRRPGARHPAPALALACSLLFPLAVLAAAETPLPGFKPPPGGQPAPQGAAPVPPPTAVAPLPMRPSDSGALVELAFEPGAVELNEAARSKLTELAAKAKSDDRRMQIKAFASGAKMSGSEVRRTSLLRALAVRTYLIEEGVHSARIDVRALGAPLDGGREDRVDLILLDK